MNPNPSLLSPSDLIRGAIDDAELVATMDVRIKSGHDKERNRCALSLKETRPMTTQQEH